MLFVVKGHGIVWGESAKLIAEDLGILESQIFNLGNLIVPIIVSIMCVVGFIVAFKMPKDYDSNTVAQEIKKLNPEIEISEAQTVIETKEEKEEKDSVFVNVALCVLSGFIFGFIWPIFIFKSLGKIIQENKKVLNCLLCFFVPFYALYYLLKTNKALLKKAEENNIKIKNKSWVYIVTSLMFPILPINVVSLSVLQHDVNKF